MFAELARQGAGARTMRWWPLWVRILVVYVVAWVSWFLMNMIDDPISDALRLATWMLAFVLGFDALILIGRIYYRRRAR